MKVTKSQLTTMIREAVRNQLLRQKTSVLKEVKGASKAVLQKAGAKAKSLGWAVLPPKAFPTDENDETDRKVVLHFMYGKKEPTHYRRVIAVAWDVDQQSWVTYDSVDGEFWEEEASAGDAIEKVLYEMEFGEEEAEESARLAHQSRRKQGLATVDPNDPDELPDNW